MSIRIRFSCMDFPDSVLEPLAAQRSNGEILMHVNKAGAQLPVELHGDYKLVHWGSKSPESRLPRTGFCKKESLDTGKWQWLRPEPVRVVAVAGWSNGVWYQVRLGMQGVLIYDENEEPHCYIVTQPATHYFKIMTGAERMPLLVRQVL